MRPQRASRATSTIGAKVQCRPDAAASVAATRADFSASAGSKLAASASGTGKMVRNAVDDVVREEQRDAQPRLLDRDLLQLAGQRGPGNAKERADLAVADAGLEAVLDRQGDPGVLGQLAQLLLQGHAGEQPLDA